MDYYGDLGFGMFGWADSDIGIFGGIRSGAFQKAGQFRCSFTLYDTEFKSRTGADKMIGTLELIVSTPEAEGEPQRIKELVKLEIAKALRGQGYGRRVVDAVMRIAEDDILICDIKKTKLPFWKKMGLEDVAIRGNQMNGHLRKVHEIRPSVSAGMTMSM
ncbi:GNAT family N-acetyltransferase [Rhizobium sp. BK176]|uniref:GNAT family N-acetyltransferase n=1 Tax=Rhizobium sp. BK176 TaxID=2587071 RepID=UPI00216944E2|nr:GNAT family N-acetyltransferase [Rhizobium sp. BK176]MCS4088462.1 GNAT superfamily N-acetyltransferase [Rhizobium sp. BK176]